jgi:hypothetical protein
LKHLAEEIEGFLMSLNSKISQGLPVGPAASIVLAEAAMIDVDQHLVSRGCAHCRYVDDFRIFADSEERLAVILRGLTLYLYQNHRLSIAHEKTKIITAAEFVRVAIRNPYEMEKAEVFEKLVHLGGYGSPEDDDKGADKEEGERTISPEDIKDAEDTLMNALAAMVERNALDLGYARALVRQARLLKSTRIACYLLDNIRFYAPLANNLCIFANAISDSKTIPHLAAAIQQAIKYAKEEGGLLRVWFEWFVAEKYSLLGKRAQTFLADSPSKMSKARWAVTANDLAWVRAQKNEYFNLGPRDRRAVLYAAQILPEDERKRWLKTVIAKSSVPLEKWVATYILELGVDRFDEDIPF